MRPPRIHIVGASGSGTTSLGTALAGELGCPHFDVDSFYWLPTDPPFEQVRPLETRLGLLRTVLDSASEWTLSGSLCGWGDQVIPLFSLVVFLWLPPGPRLARLRARETLRYSAAAINAGGSHYASHQKFIEWASAYDEGDSSLRSRQLHETWLASLTCPVLRLEGEISTQAQIAAVMRQLAVSPG